MDNVLQIDKQILNSDKIICRHINNLCNSTRGEISQDILSQLRHFVEHILLKIYANGNDIEDTQDNVKQAVKYAKNQEWLRYLSRFHHFLQVSVSHRTLEEENSERLMLKYYEYLLRIKIMLHDKYSLDVLYNLEQFPIETDESLNEYYLKIVQKVDEYKKSSKNMYKYDRFYIQNIKPFFCNNKIYYEIAFIPANDKASKTDRIIAFTDREITDFYAVKLAIEDDYIEIFDKCMPIRIILDWEVSIRPCEFKNFSKIINNQTKPIGKAEERELVKYLTESGRSLAEIVVYSDEKYNEIRNRIVPNREGYHFFDLLDFCRQLIKNQGAGYNVLRYLLHHMNNRVIKEQYHESYKKNYNTGRWEYLGANNWLSNLYLANECLPFDTMPFCSGLRKHVPNISDLLIALDTAGREHEFMARVIKNNTEQKGMLYTPLEQNGEKYKLGNFEDVETLKKIYNKKLPQTQKQQARKLIIDKGYIFIEAYRDDTISIITTIKRLAQSGVSNYSNTVKHWIENSDYNISEEKKKALETMFAKSHVSVIYGAAGTGKTTFINYISNFFKEYSKLYLAYTNPAVNNLKRKVAATSDCEFMTISKFNNRYNNEIPLVGAVVIAQGGTAVFCRHGQHLVGMGEGFPTFDLLNALRRDRFQKLACFFSGKPQLLPDELVAVLVAFRRRSSHGAASLPFSVILGKTAAFVNGYLAKNRNRFFTEFLPAYQTFPDAGYVFPTENAIIDKRGEHDEAAQARFSGLRLRGGHSGDGICPESGAAPVVPYPVRDAHDLRAGRVPDRMADAGVFLGDRFLSGQRHGRELRLYLSLLGGQPDPAGVSGLCGGDADGVHHDQHHDNPDQAAGADEGRGGKGADAGQSPSGGVPRPAHAPDLHLRRMFRHVGKLRRPAPADPCQTVVGRLRRRPMAGADGGKSAVRDPR